MSKYARRGLTLSLLPVAGLPCIAGAHTLAGEENLLAQLHHQLLGMHHLPLTAILIVSGIAVLWRYLHYIARQNGRHNRQ